MVVLLSNTSADLAHGILKSGATGTYTHVSTLCTRTFCSKQFIYGILVKAFRKHLVLLQYPCLNYKEKFDVS